MRFYTVVSLATGRTVETFGTVEEAEAMVAEVRTDDPELAELLKVETIELDVPAN